MAEAKKPMSADDSQSPPTVGETLTAARLAKGLKIEDVSTAIHIRAIQIKAMEDNNLEGLPGMTYAVGFVRSYANYLGLNGADVVHRFKIEHGHSAPSQAKLSFPEPIPESRMPNLIMVGIGVFLAVVVLALWTFYSNTQNGMGNLAEQIPAEPAVTAMEEMAVTPEETVTATVAPAEPVPVAAEPSPAVSETKPAVVSETPAAASPVIEEKPVVVEMPVVVPAEKTTSSATQKSKEADDEDEAPVINIKRGKSRIILMANQASWVQITDAKNDVVYRKVLRPGDQYYVPDQPGLSMVTANAGGLDITVDGQTVSPLGKTGEIVRGINLDPARLKKNKAR